MLTLSGFLIDLNVGTSGASLFANWFDNDSLHSRILWELRFPRVATAFVTGALLGLAGTLMQVLLRNPLADPYILGVSGGASVAALLALLAGVSGWWMQTWAFSGALVSTLLVFSLAHGRGQWDTHRLLLTGVVLAAGWGALISLILTISPPTKIHGMLFWLMGDLGYSQMPLAGIYTLTAGTLIALLLAPSLNLLSGGDLKASALGVNVPRIRLVIYIVASALTAISVSQAGNIGFIGLIAPHMLRLAGVNHHRILIPCVLLLGGSLMLYADALARTILAPSQLPVGILTALLGVPLFLILLYQHRAMKYD